MGIDLYTFFLPKVSIRDLAPCLGLIARCSDLQLLVSADDNSVRRAGRDVHLASRNHGSLFS